MQEHTHIMFLELDEKSVDTFVDGKLAQINQWYPKSSDFKFVKKNPNQYGNPIAVIKWKAKNDEMESNVALANIHSLVDDINNIGGEDSFTVIINSQMKKINLGLLNHYSGVDRIQVTDTGIRNIYYLDDSTIKIGQILSNMEIDQLVMKDIPFCGSNIYKLKYLPGNHTKIGDEELELSTSVFRDTGIFKKSNINIIENSDENGNYIYQCSFEFNNKWYDSTYQLSLDYDLNAKNVSFLINGKICEDLKNISINSKNKINETHTLSIVSNIELYGNIELSLKSINNHSEYVDVLKSKFNLNVNDIDTEKDYFVYAGSPDTKFENDISLLDEFVFVPNGEYTFTANNKYYYIVIPRHMTLEFVRSSFNEVLTNNFNLTEVVLNINQELIPCNLYSLKSVLPLDADITFKPKSNEQSN